MNVYRKYCKSPEVDTGKGLILLWRITQNLTIFYLKTYLESIYLSFFLSFLLVLICTLDRMAYLKMFDVMSCDELLIIYVQVTF